MGKKHEYQAAFTCNGETVTRIQDFSEETKLHIKRNIEKVISEILSDRYDANITVRYVNKDEEKDENESVKLDELDEEAGKITVNLRLE